MFIRSFVALIGAALQIIIPRPMKKAFRPVYSIALGFYTLNDAAAAANDTADIIARIHKDTQTDRQADICM